MYNKKQKALNHLSRRFKEILTPQNYIKQKKKKNIYI